MYPLNMTLSANSSLELERQFGHLFNGIPLLAERSEVSELSGGITNRNIMIKTPLGKYVARISSNESSLLSIDRNSEYENSKIAAASKIGAPVYEYHPELGMLVIGFLEGRTYSAADVGDNLSRIAESCRILHSSPAFTREFNMFNIQLGYREIVMSKGFKIPVDYHEYEGHILQLRKAFTATASKLVPCNNDLLPANFIDDGKQIWLIDYEYSGNNDPCFELGNIWSEANLPYEALVELVDAYYQGHRPEKVARAWLFSILAKYGWTLWASIQDSISEIEFDFWSWGMVKYEDAKSTFSSKKYQEGISLL